MLTSALALILLVKPDLAKIHRIVMMGDSITQMGGSPKGYVTLVDQTLDASRPADPF